jgi:putative ABC transport system permease protein
MLRYELRQALSLFRKEPGFAAAAVLTLVVGIGANVALFGLVEAVLLRPLPYDRAGDLVMLRHRDLRTGLTKPDVAVGDFVDLRARQQSLESLSGYGGYQTTYLDGTQPRRVEGAVVTPDALQALRVRPSLGRLLGEHDATPGAAPAAMVSHEFWRTELGSDARVLSRTIQLGPSRVAIVGVLPAGFRMPGMPATEIAVAQALPSSAPAARRSGWIYALGRLRAGRTAADAAAEFTTLSQQFEREHPTQNIGSRYEVLSMRDALVGDTRQPLLLMLGAVAFVLLMACANVGNLMLARALGRQHEIGIRMALGASRSRLARHVLAEGLALALAGGALSVVVAWYVTPAAASLVPDAVLVPGLDDVSVNPAVLLFALGASVVTALLFASVACLGITRQTAGAPRERHGTTAPRARLAASSLVVAEVALAVILLAGASLTLRSFANQLAVDPGFDPTDVLTVQLALPSGRYESDDARRGFYTRAFDGVRALPGVQSAGAAMVTPLTGNNWTAPLQRVDRPLPAGERPPEVGWQLASRGYFESLRIPLRRGRLFEPADATGPPVVIVSQSVADRHFAGEAVLGRRLDLGDVQAEIVGVVGDIRRASLTDAPRADLYFPFERAMPPSTTMFVRASGDPAAALASIRRAVHAIEPHAVVDRPRTLAHIADESAAVARLAAWLLGAFAAIAVLLAVVGVYGVMSYRVGRRTRELGTRVALGATPAAIARLVLRQALVLLGTGLGLGIAGAVLCGGVLASLLYDVSPRDPLTLTAAAVLLGTASLVASYLPARRAARIDPVKALMTE